jgi:hypothetical protein
MKFLTTSITASILLLATGCATQTEVDQQTPEVAVAEASLTVAECDTQLNRCLGGPLGWLFGAGCRAQHTTCLASASLPAPVQEAVSGATACVRSGAACLDGANVVEAAACAVEEAECLAAVLDVNVDIDGTVGGVSECASDAVACINGADAATDLTGCGTDLVSCTVEKAAEVVEAVIPEQVTEAIETVVGCTTDLDACVAAAATPAALAACGTENAECVAGALDVTLPEVPAEEVVSCATEATDCTLEAESLGDVAACAEELVSCAQAAVTPAVINPICLLFPFLCR